MPPVVELQLEKMLDMNFSSQNISYITDPKYWPWVKTRDYLARKLTKAIESNYLILGSNGMQFESSTGLGFLTQDL